MLEELVVENLVLVRSARLSLHPGLNVLTGETGAGKTILAEAVGLLLGGRADAALVGPAGAEAYVEATFSDVELPEELAELAPEDAEGVIVARRVGREGRSRALLYGRSCTRDDLERIGQSLIEMVSQHEARRLVRPAVQLDLLDASGGDDAGRAARRDGDGLERARRRPPRARRGRGRRRRRAGAPGRAARARRRGRGGRSATRRGGRPRARARPAAPSRRPARGRARGRRAAQPRRGLRRRGAGGRGGARAGPRARARRGARRAGRRARAHRRGAARDRDRSCAPTSPASTPIPAVLDRIEERLEQLAELRRRFGGATRPPTCGRAPRRPRASWPRASAPTSASRAPRPRSRGPRRPPTASRLPCTRGARRPRKPFARSVERHLADMGMDGARLEVSIAEAPLGARGRDAVELRLAANPGLPGGAARQRRLGRRALAHRARRAPGGARRRGDRDARLRRGRRRHRRPHGARADRQAARARRDGAGALHHAPAADRGGRRPPLPGREDAGRDERGARRRALARRGARGARAHARRRRRRHRRPCARGQPARRRDLARDPNGGCPHARMHPMAEPCASLRSGLLAVLLLAALAAAGATASPRAAALPERALRRAGRRRLAQLRRLRAADHAAPGAHAALVPEHAHARAQRADARLRRRDGQRATTYSRIYLPADGATNVSFVVDDNSRQPEIYLSLQLHGGVGHVSVHARSQAARETCAGASASTSAPLTLSRARARSRRRRSPRRRRCAASRRARRSSACRSRRRSGSRPRAPGAT